jgi:hypothetical protein
VAGIPLTSWPARIRFPRHSLHLPVSDVQDLCEADEPEVLAPQRSNSGGGTGHKHADHQPPRYKLLDSSDQNRDSPAQREFYIVKDYVAGSGG